MISAVLRQATEQLSSCTDVPQLEAEILLGHLLQQSRSYLLARSKESLLPNNENAFWQLVNRRLEGEPIAYLLGYKEFWSLNLLVTKDVLIPRPETELLVELVLKNVSATKIRLADLGTGSGAIALSIAHERPNWEIIATDQSAASLIVAKKNAERLKIENVTFLQGEWCTPLEGRFDVIVSNPPYISEDDDHLTHGDLRFEPRDALISGKDGLSALGEIVISSKSILKENGYLFLEHGYEQGEAVRSFFAKAGYIIVKTYKDLSGLERVTVGRAKSIFV